MQPPMDQWAVFNEFLLRGNLDRFTKILARYELFKQTINLPGDIVECGVFKGAGLLMWAKMIQIFNPQSSKKVIGFDLFDQDPEIHTHQWDTRFRPDESKQVSPDALMDIAREQGLEHRIEIIPGDGSITMPEYARAHRGFRISLLNVDFDNYDPVKASLETFFPRVVPSGMVIFDDYAIAHFGESDAVDEYLAESDYVLETLPWCLSPKAFIIKGKKRM